MADKKEFILVCGVPHGGTTVVRKLIGNINGVHDHPHEIDAIMGIDYNHFLKKIEDTAHKAIVVKSPFTPRNITNYKSFKVIFVLKNPWDCFGSYRKRFKTEAHYTKAYVDRYGIGSYCALAEIWLNIRNNPEQFPNIYPIKYEEMFEDDYAKVKDMVRWLGFSWVDNIINSERVAGHQNWNNKPVPKVENPNTLKNTGADNVPLRYWQINQPFHDMTGQSREYIFRNTKLHLDNLATSKDKDGSNILKRLDYVKYGDYGQCEKDI